MGRVGTKNGTGVHIVCRLRELRPSSITGRQVVEEIARLYGRDHAPSENYYFAIERGQANPNVALCNRIVWALRSLTGNEDITLETVWPHQGPPNKRGKR